MDFEASRTATLAGGAPHWHGLINSLAGLVVAGGTVWLVRIIGYWAFGREAMGFGDVTLMAMIGSFIGWQPSLMVFFMLAPLCALIITLGGFLVKAITRSTQSFREIPFGPYLSVGAMLIVLFWKQQFSTFDTFFSRGPFLLIVFILMGLVLFPLLVLMRAIKHRLGFEDDWYEDEVLEWTSGDQLTFYANKNELTDRNPLKPSNWPGVTAGQGTLHTNQWRDSR